MSSQARMYDILMRLAASPIEPVRSTRASNSALPGPIAISRFEMMRIRGWTQAVFGLVFGSIAFKGML
jgi:hypothetical protein